MQVDPSLPAPGSEAQTHCTPAPLAVDTAAPENHDDGDGDEDKASAAIIHPDSVSLS